MHDDATLIERARSGDRDAFGILARRHFGGVWAVAWAVLGRRQDAEDAAQDALVRAWERLDQCRDPGRFRAWLVQVARSVALNRLDTRRRRAADELPEHLEAGGPSPFDAAHRDELRRRLARAAAELTESQRTVLLLYDLEGWSHDEIGAALDLRPATSRRHLSDARRRMRALLEAQLNPVSRSDGDRP